MPPFSRSRCSQALVGVLLFLSAVGCSTEKKEDPAPPAPAPTGVVEGTISPANALNAIYLTPAGSQSGLATGPDATGYFLFKDVPAGRYNLSFAQGADYMQPAPRPLEVVAGSTFSAGTIAVASKGPASYPLRGTVSWKANATSQVATTVSGSLNTLAGVATSVNILATAQSGSAAGIVGLTLPYFGGVGLYRLENVTTSGFATYLTTSGGVPTGSFTTSGYLGVQGTITITTSDATARTLAGTFGYTAYDPAGSAALGTNRVVISEGSFTLSY